MSKNSVEEPVEDEEVMTDADFERAMEQLREEGGDDVNDLLVAMSENRIISWEEAERILGDTTSEPVKSSLPQQTRPTEPDNDTDVDWCVQRLMNNDPKLVEINLNNMKRTPVPKIKRVIEACRNNEYLEKLSLANMGLYDMDVQPLIDVLEHNTTLRCLNLETNYLSGDFFARLFKTALTNQTLEEVKAVNQGVAFSTTAEREIIDAITENRGLTKVSINLRLSEGRFKIEQATIRNQEIRRILRRQEAAAQAQAEADAKAQAARGPTTRLAKEDKKPSAATELARKMTPSKLAVAGASSQPKASASSTSTDSHALRDKARDMEREAAKPKEPKKSAERVLLAERLKETGVELDTSVAARRAKFGDKAAAAKASTEKAEKPKAPEKPKVPLKKEAEKPTPAATTTTTDGTSTSKPKYVPSWREKLADRDAKAKQFAEELNSTAKSPKDETTTTTKSTSNDVGKKTKLKKTEEEKEAEVGHPSEEGKKRTVKKKKTTKKEEDEAEAEEKKLEEPKKAPSWRDRLNAQK